MRKFIFLLLVFLSLNACNSKLMEENNTISFDWQGHRGARGLVPENSIPSFLKALEFPEIKTLELDLVVSKDNKLVISHEPWLSHHICSYPHPNYNLVKETEEDSLIIYQMDYEKVKSFDCGSFGNNRFPDQHKMTTYKPLLSEMVENVRNFCDVQQKDLPYFNIELKSRPEWYDKKIPAPDEFVSLVLAQLKKLNIEDKTILQSFDINVLEALKKQTTMPISYLTEKAEDHQKQLEKLSFTPTYYSPYYIHVTKKMIEDMHEKDIKVVCWTVNKTPDMEALKRMGVDGIITDYPNKIPKLEK
jgi:glycerophosphoryl diester phosphodiesterase